MGNLKALEGRDKWGGVVLNPGCRNNCFFCRPPRTVSRNEIDRQEKSAFANLDEFQRAGLRRIVISGSDPIEHPEIARFIERSKECGFHEVQLATHGRRLSDKRFAAEVIDSGLDSVRIPIYGPIAKIHDSITGSTGSFNETVQGILHLRSRDNIAVYIGSLITRKNVDFCREIIVLARDLGASRLDFSIPCIPNDDFTFYIPIKELPETVRKLHHYARIVDMHTVFLEIPYCAFGFQSDLVFNTIRPPELGDKCQPPNEFKTETRNMPSYRVKMKVGICSGCQCFDFCDGFFKNDVEKYGVGDLEKIRSLE